MARCIGGCATFSVVARGRSDGRNKHASIVGLWHVIYTVDTASPSGAFPPTPFQFVETFKTWHGDGTEFENALPPTGGDICFGIWKESHGGVKLHHIGLMFDRIVRRRPLSACCLSETDRSFSAKARR